MQAASLRQRKQHVLRVATYTRTPGGRYREDGLFSGSAFRDEHLAPAFETAQREDATLLVDLDDTAGYASSFLEEAFGGLARTYGIDAVLERLDIKSTAEPYLIADILQQYIPEANDK